MATTDRNDQERNQDQNQNQNQNQGQNQQNQPRNEQQGQEQNRAQNQGQGQTNNPNQSTNPNQNQNTESRPNSGTADNTAPFKITGNWNQQSTQLQQDYPQLTSEDLNAAPGKENELLERLGTKLNKSRDEVVNMINKYNTEY